MSGRNKDLYGTRSVGDGKVGFPNCPAHAVLRRHCGGAWALSQTDMCLSFLICKTTIIEIHLKTVVKFGKGPCDSLTAVMVTVTRCWLCCSDPLCHEDDP